MDAYTWTAAAGHQLVGRVRGETLEQLLQHAATAAAAKGMAGTLCLYKPGEEPPTVETRVTVPSRERWESYRMHRRRKLRGSASQLRVPARERLRKKRRTRNP